MVRVVTPVFSAISSMVSRRDDSSSRRMVHRLMTSAFRGMDSDAGRRRDPGLDRFAPPAGGEAEEPVRRSHEEIGEAREQGKRHRCKERHARGERSHGCADQVGAERGLRVEHLERGEFSS